MTSDLITTDSPFSERERAIARALTNLIIPASADGRMPSAAAYDVLGSIVETAPQQIDRIKSDIAAVETAAAATHDDPFDELGVDEQTSIASAIRERDPEFGRGLATGTAICYYQQDAVLEGLGLPARAPFPDGFTVKSGDLSLLDPVRKRGQMYREG
jgi:hypothetical protein